jgi:PAS domain S-box-containing protein
MMAIQRSEPQERSYQEALATLQRLAASGQPPPPASAPEAPPLPPRATSLPAWTEQSFRELVEGLPDAVVVIDTRGVIVLVNRQTEQLFGYPRAELLGEAIEILVPERLRRGHVGRRDGYLTEADPKPRPLGVGRELLGRRKDGSELPVEISLSPMGAGAGRLVTAVIRDLTERKRGEAKFRTLVENIPAVTFVAPLDDSSPELYVSPQIEKLLGFKQKEWVEDPVLWHRQLHPEDRDRWNRHFAPTCAEGTPFRSTYRFLNKDGRTVWVHGSANFVRDEYDRLLFLQGVAFDVTEIKEAQEERERFFSLSLDLFCVAGMDGTFRRVNQAFCSVLGYRTEELLERPILELVHPDDQETTSQQLAGLARGEPTERFENRYRCRDGSYRWLQWVAAPFTERQLCFAAARDVTREKQAEEELLQAKAELERRVQQRTEELTRLVAQLEERNKELQKYAYHATHDIKEPLRTILTQTQKVVRTYAEQLPGEASKWLGDVISAVGRMRVLLERLKDYAEVNRVAPPVRVDCSKAVGTALVNLKAAIEESQAEVEVLWGDPPTVNGAREHLELLFQNLIGNAIKYRSPERALRVEVGARRQADGWLFWVRDNSVGIHPKYWTKIFLIGSESKVDKRKDLVDSSWGYGLSICEKTVARHGGRIWVASEPGQGSTFYFTLPDQSPMQG